MRVRRVVTGHDESGKAIVVSDEEVEPSEREFAPKWSIWAADEPVAMPDDGGGPAFAGPLIPRPGGFHVIMMTFPPHFNPDRMMDTSDPVRAAEQAREYTSRSVPLVADPNPPGTYGTIAGFTGLHATASIDCVMQLTGHSVLVMEDAEVLLDPGDWLIVNGVTHGWRNDGDEPSLIACFIAGAEHRGVPLRRT